MSNPKRDVPLETFRFYNDKNNEKSETSVSDKIVKKDQDENRKKALEMLEHNTATLTDSDKLFKKKPERKRQFSEIPATPPKQSKRSTETFMPSESKTNRSFPVIKTPAPVWKNKTLNKLKNDGRRSMAMLSSPSIMAMKSKRSSETSVSDGTSKEKKQKSNDPFNVDNIFDELKNSNKSTKEAAPKDHDSYKQRDIISKSPVSVKSTECNSFDEQQGNGSTSDLSPVQRLNIDWDGIKPDVLRHFTEASANFRLILDELKKANEKILKFRQNLAESEYK